MEEKIYDRQVAKQSLSFRVVDQQQIERHFTLFELTELYMFEPDMLDDPHSKKSKRTTTTLKPTVLYYYNYCYTTTTILLLYYYTITTTTVPVKCLDTASHSLNEKVCPNF